MRSTRFKIAFLVAACLAVAATFWIVSVSVNAPTGSPPRETALAPATPVAEPSLWPTWRGAIQSAELNGAGFFDRKKSRDFSASVQPAEKKYVVELNARSFLPLKGAVALDAVFNGQAGERTAYLQFSEHPTETQRREIRQSGVELVRYAAGYAWTARGTRAAMEAVLKLPFVRAAAAIDARDKMHAAVFAEKCPAYAFTPDGAVRLSVITLPGTAEGDLNAAVARHPTLAGAAISTSPDSVLGPRFQIALPQAAMRQLAELEAVAFVGFAAPPVANRDATIDASSNIEDVRSNPPGLSGGGVKVSVHEIGRPEAHSDLGERVTIVENDASTLQSNMNHATAVTGVVIGDGSTQPTAKGVAPGAQVLSYSVGLDDPFETFDLRDAAAKGARISNHSYGPDGLAVWGDYDPISADWDAAIRDNSLIVATAANEESGGLFKHIDFFVGAKNTICMSASNSSAKAFDNFPPQTPSDGIASYAEFGPMNDGRVKPDLVSFGGNGPGTPAGVTLLSGLNGTQTNNGTSFATPVAVGVSALIFQQYHSVFGSDPTAALTKALLCNAATDLGPPGPDARYGFGIINAEEAIRAINRRQNSPNSPFLEDGVANSVTKEYLLDVRDVPQLRLTLCWMDVAGSPAAARALVNNLDMVLEAPNGTRFNPFTLDPLNPSSPAGVSAANAVDPIEQIFVDAPANGIWRILVSGVSVPVGEQSFAIACNFSLLPAQLLPTISASPDNGPVPLAVSLSATSSVGSITHYKWAFGDGSSEDGATLSTLSHTYAAPGSYTVTLTLNGTASGTRTIIVTKSVKPGLVTKARAALDFRASIDAQDDDFQFTLRAADLVKPGNEVQTMIKAGALAGKTFIVKLGGTADGNSPPTRLVTAVVDARGNDSRRTVLQLGTSTFKLNLTKGEMLVQLKDLPLEQIFRKAGMSRSPSSAGIHELPVEIETDTTIYRGLLRLNFKNTKGLNATAKSL